MKAIPDAVRARIVELLQAKNPLPVSVIAKRVGVGRTAVWKVKREELERAIREGDQA